MESQGPLAACKNTEEKLCSALLPRRTISVLLDRAYIQEGLLRDVSPMSVDSSQNCCQQLEQRTSKRTLEPNNARQKGKGAK